MKQIFVMLCTAMVFVFAVAANGATLRHQATVHGDHITLGDLFDGLPPERAGIAIAQSPPLGRHYTLEAQWVARVAHAYSVPWSTSGAHERVIVTRASQRIGPERITEALRAELGGRVSGERLDILLDNRMAQYHLPVDAAPTLAIRDLSVESTTGRFIALMVAPADGDPVIRVHLTGRVAAVSEVPVVSRRIRPGEVISNADVIWMEVPESRLTSDIVRELGDLVGMSPRRALNPDSPVRLHDLRPPLDVRRGTAVTMVMRSGPLVITARGRALSDGARGEVIRVLNTSSNRTIEAVVSGPDQVVVHADPMLAAAGP